MDNKQIAQLEALAEGLDGNGHTKDSELVTLAIKHIAELEAECEEGNRVLIATRNMSAETCDKLKQRIRELEARLEKRNMLWAVAYGMYTDFTKEEVDKMTTSIKDIWNLIDEEIIKDHT